MRTIVLAALALLVALSPTVQAQRRTQPYPLRSSTPLDRDDINRMLETAERSGQSWISDPTRTAQAIIRYVEASAEESRAQVNVTRDDAPRRNPRTSTVIVTREGLQDDSIAGERYGFVFARSPSGTAWRVTWASTAHRCWPGRGVSNAYVSAACV